MDWLRNIFSGGSLVNTAPINYTAGGTIGNPTAGIGDIGYIPPGPASQGYSGPVSQTGRPSVGMGSDPYKKSWWDDFRSGLDRDFLAAAAQSLGAGGSGYRGRGGGGGVGRAGGRYGANIRPAEPVGAGMPVPGTAPNPSFATGLVLPRRRQDQYSGGY